ncbi:MAG TPA: Fe-S cluster assembly protein SufD [bacterium]|nr:Fe-S cluster assembly protein SufD [bacterium]
MSETHSVATAALSRDLVDRLSDAAGDPAWLRTRRLEAWDAFVRLPLPSPTDEEWRRTDLSGLPLDALRPLPPSVGTQKGRPPASLMRLIGDPAAAAGLRLVVDGIQIQSRLASDLAKSGVIFMSLPEAVAAHPDLVRQYLGSVVRDDESKFRALHAALWTGGTFLYVPKNVEIDLQLVSGTWLDQDGVAHTPHTLVVAEERSRVTLVELSGSVDGGVGPGLVPAARAHTRASQNLGLRREPGRREPVRPTLVNHVVELIPKAGAQIRYVTLQDWGRNVWEIGIVRAVLERDATVHSLMVAFGAGLVKTNVESRLVGQGSTSEMLGVLFGDGTQHFDYHTLQEHAAPNTTSDLLYKGALKDTARSVFAGLIRADYGAQKTNAFQLNRNLILSEGARADSMPKLEIMANDLRCTHGASTSRLNEDQIFYLMSRGLTRSTAVRMMVDGFFAEIFDRIPLELIRERLSEAIERKMAKVA